MNPLRMPGRLIRKRGEGKEEDGVYRSEERKNKRGESFFWRVELALQSLLSPCSEWKGREGALAKTLESDPH